MSRSVSGSGLYPSAVLNNQQLISIMLNIEDIQKALKQEDLKVLKSLGQNFLVDEGALSDIVAAAELGPDDTVLEVGPGLGTLTCALASRVRRVIAVEKDRKMSAYLRREMAGRHGVEIVTEDILRLNLSEFLAARDVKDYKVVANIPYYITSPIIRLMLEASRPPREMVILVQKEVAERICAPKGKMSILALSVLLYGEPSLVRRVPRACFYPVPKVDSAVLRISAIGSRYSAEERQSILRLIKIGFSAKRKKLANNLANGLKADKQLVEERLVSAGLSKDARAEDLELGDWARLSRAEIFARTA